METSSESIVHILNRYPTLKYDIKTNKISGDVNIDKYIKDEHIVDTFEIEIDFNSFIPKVKEKGNKITEYPHKYKNGVLCLATNFDQEIFLQHNTIYEWFEYFVINYFCSYKYYKKYKCYPYGERSHGVIGILESLLEYFRINDTQHTISMLNYIVNKKYRGHNICPCGSGEKIRNCHKEQILEAQSSKLIICFKNAYEEILREVKRYEKEKK